MFTVQVSELITRKQTAVGSSILGDKLTTWPTIYDHWPSSKGERSRSQG